MGYKFMQRIYECDECGETPDDGEAMWHMGTGALCQACIDRDEEEDEDEENEDE